MKNWKLFVITIYSENTSDHQQHHWHFKSQLRTIHDSSNLQNKKKKLLLYLWLQRNETSGFNCENNWMKQWKCQLAQMTIWTLYLPITIINIIFTLPNQLNYTLFRALWELQCTQLSKCEHDKSSKIYI